MHAGLFATGRVVHSFIQNEILKVMALSVLRTIARNINHSSFFTIMADESTDSSNREQLVICMQWIDDELEPQEDFLGMYKLDSTDANAISMVIKDTLLRMNHSLASQATPSFFNVAR